MNNFPPNIYLNWREIKFALFFLLSFLVVVSCKTTKKASIPIKEVPVIAEDQKTRFDYKSARVLADKMEENKFNFNLLTTKFSAETNIEGKTNGFNVSIRTKKDSVLWMSFSLLGIEGARILATQDTIKFIDRVNHKFLISDYNYISQMFQTDIDFEMLQAILIGNYVEFYGEEEKIKSFREENQYVISTVRKRKLKKVLNKVNDGEPYKELIQRTYVSNDSYKITRNLINDFSNNRSFDATYQDFQKVDSLFFPFKQHFEITSTKKITVDINYNKVESVNELSFPFNIPSKYEPLR